MPLIAHRQTRPPWLWGPRSAEPSWTLHAVLLLMLLAAVVRAASGEEPMRDAPGAAAPASPGAFRRSAPPPSWGAAVPAPQPAPAEIDDNPGSPGRAAMLLWLAAAAALSPALTQIFPAFAASRAVRSLWWTLLLAGLAAAGGKFGTIVALGILLAAAAFIETTGRAWRALPDVLWIGGAALFGLAAWAVWSSPGKGGLAAIGFLCVGTGYLKAAFFPSPGFDRAAFGLLVGGLAALMARLLSLATAA